MEQGHWSYPRAAGCPKHVSFTQAFLWEIVNGEAPRVAGRAGPAGIQRDTFRGDGGQVKEVAVGFEAGVGIEDADCGVHVIEEGQRGVQPALGAPLSGIGLEDGVGQGWQCLDAGQSE